MACSVVSTLGEPFERIARIVFEETARSRERLHQARGALHCDATFVLTGGFQVSGDCPCAEEYLDALCLVLLYLGGLDPANVHSYGAIARKHCRLRVVPDVQRHRRGRRTQQRVDRLASGAIGRALATDRQRALLVDVVTEAGSAAPLEDDAQLLRSLAERRARRFGGDADRHLSRVAEDLRVVRAAADEHGPRRRDTDGTLVSWWEHYVERGLGQRERLGVLPIDPASTQDGPAVDVADRSAVAVLERIEDRHAVAAVTGISPGDDVDAALAHTFAAGVIGRDEPAARDATIGLLRRMTGQGLLGSSRLSSIVNNPGQLDEIVEAARRVPVGR